MWFLDILHFKYFFSCSFEAGTGDDPYLQSHIATVILCVSGSRYIQIDLAMFGGEILCQVEINYLHWLLLCSAKVYNSFLVFPILQ